MVVRQVKIISTPQILQCGIKPSDCMAWIEESFRQKYEAQLPVKNSIHPQGDDFFNTMPTLLPNRFSRFGIKIVSRMEEEVPALKSDILLYDSKTGRLLAIIDGDWITAMRTGAATALAVRTLCSSKTDAYSLMGLGNTARATALCLLADHAEDTVRFRLLRYKNQTELFIERFKDYPNAAFEIVDSMEAFIGGAQVIISCVTNAHGEVFCTDDTMFQKGVLVVPVHSRGFQNCDLCFDKVYGDDTGHIAGFKYFSKFRRYNELSQVLLGEDPGRENDEERILSYNAGLAIHDILFASRIYDLVGDEGSSCFTWERNTSKFWV